ncbi:hypothetical protein B0H14DRAFT_2657012 [Mycena olivaceomarginata]|nr:hypothetical protein B0H14DRAFT_2657012 [Mycena olivaceomarginata]
MGSDPKKTAKPRALWPKLLAQPVKQCCGKPHKNPNKPKDTVPKLTLKIPSRPDKSASPTSNSDSKVIETTDNQSSISIDNTMTIWIWSRQRQKAYWVYLAETPQMTMTMTMMVPKRMRRSRRSRTRRTRMRRTQWTKRMRTRTRTRTTILNLTGDTDFHLDFVVPVGGATDTVTVSSAITHTQLFDQITEEMGVCKRELNIVSWLKDKDKPKLLSTPNHIVKLFKDACEELVNCKKPDAKALKKKFEVMITDLSTKNGKEKTDKAAKKQQSKGKQHTDDSDSETDTQVNKGKKTPAQALHDLEQDHRKGSTPQQHCPPVTLGLSMTTGTKATAPSHCAPQNAPLPPPPPYPYYYPPGPYPHVYYPPPPAPPTHLPDLVPAPPATNLKKTISIDSNDNDDPTLFPTIKDWLLDLDTSEHGQDGHHFSQYSDTLRTNGFAHVVQLADEGEKEGAKDVVGGYTLVGAVHGEGLREDSAD